MASNSIGFFLYIAAGSMVVWEYSWKVEEDYEGDNDEKNYLIGEYHATKHIVSDRGTLSMCMDNSSCSSLNSKIRFEEEGAVVRLAHDHPGN